METPGDGCEETQEPWVTADLENDTRFPDVARWLADRGIRSLCVVPATTALRKLGALAFGSRVAGAYSETDVIFLHQVARQVAGQWTTRFTSNRHSRFSRSSRGSTIFLACCST